MFSAAFFNANAKDLIFMTENTNANFNWYPGHMAKTRRLISENLKLIDVLVEMIDARIPYSGRNPDFDDLLGSKPRVVVMNKSDLADEKCLAMWKKYYTDRGYKCIYINSLTGKNTEKIIEEAKNAISEKIEKDQSRGLTRSIKLMIVGIPNVGKSSLINRLSGKAGAKTGDRPGVTKGKQWIRLKNGVELLDTPGILWPKFENRLTGLKLAMVGSIRDEIVDPEELCCHLLSYLKKHYKDLLCARYKLTEPIDDMESFELLEYIGKKRGFIVSGGEIDTYRCANVVLDEFRGAKIGKITLETPADIDKI